MDGMTEKMPTRGMSLAQRIDYYTDKTGDCWSWKGVKFPNGRAQLHWEGKTQSATRLIMRERVGRKLATNEFVCHSCDNRWCVNPDHLFVGTPKENSEDMVSKNRSCIGERNPISILTEQEVKRIKRSRLPQTTLARRYGVSKHAIWRIVHGKNWAHVDG